MDITSNIAKLKKAGVQRILSDTDLRELFHKTALEVFGENCLNCDGKIQQKFTELINHQNPELMSKLKYRLKKGTVISMNSPSWKEDINNDNLTNQKAEMLLNITLKYIDRFEDAPDIEKLRKMKEQGVKTLKEALSKGASGKKVASHEDSLKEELIALDNIGKATADKILKVYPTKDVLLDAINADVDMPFLGAREAAAKEGLKALK